MQGYDRSFDVLLNSGSYLLPDYETSEVSLNDILVDARTRSITLPLAAPRLDFGGIAKGWAAHQAVQKLKQSARLWVDAGGDIAVTGPLLEWRAMGNWTIENPFDWNSNLGDYPS